MKRFVLPILLIGALALAAAFVVNGRYSAFAIGRGQTFVLDRLTGSSWVCASYRCRPTEEKTLDSQALKTMKSLDDLVPKEGTK